MAGGSGTSNIRSSSRVSARARLAAVLGLLTFCLAGCYGPNDQITVVRDPATGGVALQLGLCPGERVDAVRLRSDSGGGAPVDWEVSRDSDDGGGDPVTRLAFVPVGSTPEGFRSVVPLSGAVPSEGWVEAELSGGAVAITRSHFTLSTLEDTSTETSSRLHQAATQNCAERRPFRSSWWITIPSIAVLVWVGALLVRRSRRASRES